MITPTLYSLDLGGIRRDLAPPVGSDSVITPTQYSLDLGGIRRDLAPPVDSLVDRGRVWPVGQSNRAVCVCWYLRLAHQDLLTVPASHSN